jgi:nicotinamidase-related amidase
MQVPTKEKYLSTENLDKEIQEIRQEILESGGRERDFHLKGNHALLVTDMQEYFLSPESHAFIPSAEAIIPNIIHLISFFDQIGYPVIFTQHVNTLEDAGNIKSWWNDLIKKESPYSEISHHLTSLNRSIVQSFNRSIASPPNHPSTLPLIIQKSQYDAFHQTELEDLLRKNNIDTLIICGVMTNLCCETTLRSAFGRGFNAILPMDATAAYKRSYHISTFVNLSFGFCPVKTTNEILKIINS